MKHVHKAHSYEFTAITFLCPFLFLLIIAVPLNASAEQIPPVVITCLGDSVTHSYPYGDGFHNPEGQPDPYEDYASTYPGQLANLLEQHYYPRRFEVHNHGINGETAGGLRDKLNPEHAHFADLLVDNPDLVLLMIGGNDLAGAGSAEEFGPIVNQTVSEVEECINFIKAHINPDGQPPKIILSAFTPNRIADMGGWNPNLGIQIYNGQNWLKILYRDLEELEGQVDRYFYSNFNDLYDSGSGKAWADMMYDNVHPNDGGHAILAQNWLDELEAFPELMDSDNDGLSDAEESFYTTNPQLADTDDDGFSDLLEITCADADTAKNQDLKPVLRINFQPFDTSTPNNYLNDSGRTFSTTTGYGW
ncbi:MAG: GDSL-type esterase/lipase family protein [Candidatus Tritonobacter lacicola]|nr:GDSL-type esterase/lipase family protein [Candidatus Tritonobacter lacicola]